MQSVSMDKICIKCQSYGKNKGKYDQFVHCWISPESDNGENDKQHQNNKIWLDVFNIINR